MEKYGVFINYRHEDYYFALRVYDYLKNRGLDPFIDYDLHQGQFEERLYAQIRETPYFLMVLTSRSCIDVGEDDVYCREIQTALESGSTILMVAEAGFDGSDFDRLSFSNPEYVRTLKGHQRYEIDRKMDNFYSRMETLCNRDIDVQRIWDAISWREYARCNSNVLFTSREVLEKGGIASWKNRFGADLEYYVDHDFGRAPFEGEYRIRHINMACYAASIIFAPDRDMVDYLAYDHGKMFNVISTLFHDPDFSMTLITNTPDSPAAIDAVESQKLGNSAFDDDPRAVFLSSYQGVHRLLQEEPFGSARKDHRFTYLLTESYMPFAYFQIIYKDAWREFNHIKIDLYTEGLANNISRRSLIVFEQDDRDTYLFLHNQFSHLQERSRRTSRQLIKANHERWLEEWEDYLADRY